VEDEDRIIAPHVSILGAATPTIFEHLTETDLLSGLIPRFAIVWPQSRPLRRPFYQAGGDTETQRRALYGWLSKLHEWGLSPRAASPIGSLARHGRAVEFSAEALASLDAFAVQVETTAAAATEAAKVMTARLLPMAVKVAMLAAAGHPDTLEAEALVVTAADAAAACAVLTRWHRDACAFADRIGQSRFERDLQRCLRVVQARGTVPRRVVSQVTHLPKRALDQIEATLVDRGAIVVRQQPAPGRPTSTVWERSQ
jgi:hypothetical protein